MGFFALVLLLLGTGVASDADRGVRSDASEPLFYVTAPKAMVYASADESRPYVQLRMREQVYVVDAQQEWTRVRTTDGAEGYVRSGALSNVWLRVAKQSQTLYVYEGLDLVKKLPVDLGFNHVSDKERRGSLEDRDHWRTPEGQFFVVARNPRSQFYRALVLNYPNAEDASFGLQKGLISQEEHAAIVRAEQESMLPPMNTALGGWIEIHGQGTGARSNWTQGCIALRNDHMDFLWERVAAGAPVLIEP